MPILLTLLLLLSSFSVYGADESVCFGSTDNGRLENGWQLPSAGDNFKAYSSVGVASGRNYVHSSVHQIVVESYANLLQEVPDKHFVYGETGWKKGGQFKPHKTHQNGLSVDFFVPVLDSAGQSVPLPTSPLNKFGYNIEFTDTGKYKDYRIDYDAMAEHLFALKRAADRRDVKILRIIFDNELQNQLFATKKGGLLKKTLTFSRKKPWVRHDEHYHVDFIVPCREH